MDTNHYTELSLVLNHEGGMHARPAGVIVKTASQFKADVQIGVRGQFKSAKSIMSLLSLGVENGAELTVRASGEDAEQAAQTLANLIKSNFEGYLN